MFYRYSELQPIKDSRIIVISNNSSVKSGIYKKIIINNDDIWCYTDDLIKFSKFVIEELDKEEVQEELKNESSNLE